MDPVTAALVGWLVDRAATGGQRVLARWLGSDKQAKALRPVVSKAMMAAVEEIDVPGDREAVAQALRREEPGTPEIDIRDVPALRDAVWRLISPRLAVLTDRGYRVDADRLADAITQKIGLGIQLDAVRGGPLAPVADLLRHEELKGTGNRIAGAAEDTVRVLKEMQSTWGALPAPGSAPARSRPVRLAPRPAPLAGREELLAEVHRRLAGDETTGPRVVALHGLGGAGKTSLAIWHAYRHIDQYQVIWQFAADDQATMAAEFAELGWQLAGPDLLTAPNPVAQVHGILAASPDGWLLVFDNAASHAALRDFLPPAGHGHVIITSQNPTWPAGQAVEVPMLDVGVAAEFLMNRTDAADTSVARDLVRELGGLPLALEQAAAYMQATGLSIASYLELFGERRLELLSRGDLTGYDKRVTTTWALAFDQLQNAPQAAGLLRLLACCASEAIPLGLLLRPRPELAAAFGPQVRPLLAPLLDDPLAAADALAALHRYSLVSAPVDGAVSVHRLVQAVTLAQLPPETEAAWQRAAAALIEAALPHEEKLPANWPAYAALMPHARATLGTGSKGMARVAGYLGAIGDRAAALALSQQVLEARQMDLGPEHPETLNAGVEVAGWTGAEGNAAAARDQLAALLPVYERVLGAGHPDTLDARDSLALFTRDAGDAAAARDQLAALLRLREQVSGAAHMDTLGTRALLALFTGEAGDPAGARDRYAALLPVAEQVLGPEHRAVLTSRGYLARWTGEAGDAAGARDRLAALLPVYERVLGAGHPGALNARANLAYWTKQAGKSPRARKDSTPA
ncbi:MAG TPA: FxSxx-COOH system tetratricopeptide repeat protein [Streptosporangiaceae bacterium]|nr:FxSxx-COOH system tetratricopeptide repeat protein [Streptosporangiaceae bacterium]